MLRSMMELPAVVSAAIVVCSVVALSLASYALARELLARGSDPDLRELSGSVIFRVSALHGLVLALVFAQEMVNLRDVSAAASREAALVANVFYDLERYDAETAEPLQQRLASYTRHVLEDEWGRLGANGTLHDAAWADWVAVYEASLDLAPGNPRQEVLKGIVLENIREVSMLRRAREDAARTGVHPVFVTAAVIGVVLISIGYFTFAPNALNLLLLTIFSGYTGLILFFILAFSNPYMSPGVAEPIGYELLYQGDIRALGEAGRP